MPDDPIVNVAVAGGTGILGAAVLNALYETRRFNITLLSRTQATHSVSGISAAIVDYSDPKSLRKALMGQDAVVCTLSREAIPCQAALIDAAVEAGVTRFIPSEFGANLKNDNSRRLVNYRAKVEIEEYLEHKAMQSRISYTFLYTNVLMDWSIRAGILLDIVNTRAYLYDGGNAYVSMATISSAAKAVVGILSNPVGTRNRAVYIQDVMVSQRAILSYMKKISPWLQWLEEIVDLEQLEQDARQSMKVGLANMSIFHAGAMKGAFAANFGNRFDDDDNELLGIDMMSEAEMLAFLSSLLEECQLNSRDNGSGSRQ